jgi:hypothetical protein
VLVGEHVVRHSRFAGEKNGGRHPSMLHEGDSFSP